MYTILMNRKREMGKYDCPIKLRERISTLKRLFKYSTFECIVDYNKIQTL